MSALAALLDLVLPRRCVGCGSPLGPLCGQCVPAGPVLSRGRPGVFAIGDYDGPLRAALIAYKERGRRDLGRPLAGLLSRAVGAAVEGERDPPARVVLVPVPSARSAAVARGGDHMVRLARRTSSASGLRIAPGALALTRSVRDSAGLGVDERSANLRQAMTARRAPPGLAALVVDDIVTTGATLRESRRALEAAGWPVVGCAVIAETPRRFPRRVAYPVGTADAHGLA